MYKFPVLKAIIQAVRNYISKLIPDMNATTVNTRRNWRL